MEDSSFKFGVIRATSMEKSNILTISELCEIAGVSRSGYYAWLSSEQKRAAREAQDAADFQQILEAYRFRGYAKGVRGIHMRLLHTGIRMNGKKIRRLNSVLSVRSARQIHTGGCRRRSGRTTRRKTL